MPLPHIWHLFQTGHFARRDPHQHLRLIDGDAPLRNHGHLTASPGPLRSC